MKCVNDMCVRVRVCRMHAYGWQHIKIYAYDFNHLFLFFHFFFLFSIVQLTYSRGKNVVCLFPVCSNFFSPAHITQVSTLQISSSNNNEMGTYFSTKKKYVMHIYCALAITIFFAHFCSAFVLCCFQIMFTF